MIDISTPERQQLNVMIWGTYDLGKPRTRILIEAIRRSGASLTEIHAPVWNGAEDKSVIGKSDALKRIIRWVASYPRLILRFIQAPRPDVIVVGYLGHLDVLLLRPFAILRRTPIVWDAFLSLYDTVVSDRQLVSPRHPAAFVLRAWEWLACRAANLIVLDTEAQAHLFCTFYNLQESKVTSVFVGAEETVFPRAAPKIREKRSTVLFYGQFIPLHGIATIIEAARLASDRQIDWIITRTGQHAGMLRQKLQDAPLANLIWEEWVSYPDLVGRIANADVCLGVFGDSEKAGRVIPNKVFQILSSGRPLVTRDGRGIRELVSENAPGIELVPPADHAALLAAVECLLAQTDFPPDLHADLRERFSIDALAECWDSILREAIIARDPSMLAIISNKKEPNA